MNITFNTNPVYFGYKRQADTHVFCEDKSTTETRQHIRRSIEEKCPFIRDEEAEFKKHMEVAALVQKLYGRNLKLPKFSEFEPGCIRGGGLNPDLFMYLSKTKNVKRIVALAPDEIKKDYTVQKAQEAEVEYFPTKVVFGEKKMLLQETPFQNEDEFIKPMLENAAASGMSEENLEKMDKNFRGFFRAEGRNYIENELIPFIKTMQKGDIFMACRFGTFRTDTAVSLNSWFNPKCKKPFQCINHKFDLIAFKNLYNKLTDEDKQKLGFTKEFEERFEEEMKKQNTMM